KLERKSKELALADIIVTPSQFVVDSLPTWVNREKVILSQFGSPVVSFTLQERTNYKKNHPLRVLFVGSMGQRKGLGDLFQAIKLLDTSEVELVVMGGLLEDISFYRNKFPNFVYEAPRSHPEVLALMRTCDVFCLPSIVEGRALVMQEAMSQGLPLIITPNTGGEDLVKEGETGFLVPIRSPEIIANRIQWFLENRDCINEMRRHAQEHAMLYTWENYSKRVINLIRQLIVK
ncbi:MAG: glycosyltransferase family 4 protein, partial [Runella zeae]